MDVSMKRYGMLFALPNELERVLAAHESGSHSLSFPIHFGKSAFAEPSSQGFQSIWNAIKRFLYQRRIMTFRVVAASTIEEGRIHRVKFMPTSRCEPFMVDENDWMPFINVLLQAKAFISPQQREGFLNCDSEQCFTEEDAKHVVRRQLHFHFSGN
jgi:hypothetical protein